MDGRELYMLKEDKEGERIHHAFRVHTKLSQAVRVAIYENPVPFPLKLPPNERHQKHITVDGGESC